MTAPGRQRPWPGRLQEGLLFDLPAPKPAGLFTAPSRSFKGTSSVIVQGPQCWKVHNAYLAQLTVPDQLELMVGGS